MGSAHSYDYDPPDGFSGDTSFRYTVRDTWEQGLESPNLATVSIHVRALQAGFVVESCDGRTCIFDGGAPYSSPEAVQWTWALEDDPSALPVERFGQRIQYTFENGGRHEVTLTVENAAENQASTTQPSTCRHGPTSRSRATTAPATSPWTSARTPPASTGPSATAPRRAPATRNTPTRTAAATGHGSGRRASPESWRRRRTSWTCHRAPGSP